MSNTDRFKISWRMKTGVQTVTIPLPHSVFFAAPHIVRGLLVLEVKICNPDFRIERKLFSRHIFKYISTAIIEKTWLST